MWYTCHYEAAFLKLVLTCEFCENHNLPAAWKRCRYMPYQHVLSLCRLWFYLLIKALYNIVYIICFPTKSPFITLNNWQNIVLLSFRLHHCGIICRRSPAYGGLLLGALTVDPTRVQTPWRTFLPKYWIRPCWQLLLSGCKLPELTSMLSWRITWGHFVILFTEESSQAIDGTDTDNQTQNKCSAVAEMGDRLATIDMGRKFGGCAPFWGWARFLFNTMWPGPRPTSVPSGILIHPAVWPQ